MTADRPYRDARPEAEALAELGLHAGTQFDSLCVGALERVIAGGLSSRSALTA